MGCKRSSEVVLHAGVFTDCLSASYMQCAAAVVVCEVLAAIKHVCAIETCKGKQVQLRAPKSSMQLR